MGDQGLDSRIAERACAIAPALRMLYAAAIGGGGAGRGDDTDGAGGSAEGASGAGGILPSGAAAAVAVFYGGAVAPAPSGPPPRRPPLRLTDMEWAGANADRAVGSAKSPAPIRAAGSSAAADPAASELSAADAESLRAAFAAYLARHGEPPNIVIADVHGFFALGGDIAAARCAALAFQCGEHKDRKRASGSTDAGADAANANREPSPSLDCLPNREASLPLGRLAGKIAVVTGGAQGFGKGIAESLAAEGAYVVVADLNPEGARACAAALTQTYGAGRAIAVHANVSDEDSVRAMIREAVLSYGGLDLYISNAGIAIAGGLPEMSKEKFELVTSVNYTGYFLGAKHASAPMRRQRAFFPSYTADIIEINSKSGLEGSNKNFAYAGSKFGGVGLTQSFALELVEHGIKVNAICPGNFLDGPLWSDSEKGLFRQYFEAGKVPGAKSVADVRRYYESRVPMRRGCAIADVARAIFYLVEQQYETGQALPVTGGQIMLN